LFPDPNYDFSYSDSSDHHSFSVYDLFGLISDDVVGTQIVIPGLSNRILGGVDTYESYHEILQKIKENDGYIIFSKEKFPMFDTDSCYWLDVSGIYNNLAVKSLDDKTLQVYFETSNSCKILNYFSYTK